MPGPERTQQLASLKLDGRIVLPSDEDWDEARAVWNGMIYRQPAAVLQAASPEDIAAGIEAARAHGLALAVRGGGHNVAGNSTIDGGLVIDLGRMNDVGVNPGTRIVTVAGGASLGDLDRGTCRPGSETEPCRNPSSTRSPKVASLAEKLPGRKARGRFPSASVSMSMPSCSIFFCIFRSYAPRYLS